MNTSLICLSLKYLRRNYELISNISKWIHFELTKHNYKESKFVKSLDKKDFEVIKTLIKFNEDIDLLSKYLISYCLYTTNCFDIIKLLIDNGADIHRGNDYILRHASSYNHFDIVKFLIDNGANIHSIGDQSLRYASRNGHFEVVKILIENGADVHAEDDYSLINVSSNGHIEIVKLLINNGANIHAQDNQALINACNNVHFEVVKILIENGADVHARDDRALLYACRENHLEIVEFLINNKEYSKEILQHMNVNSENIDMFNFLKSLN